MILDVRTPAEYAGVDGSKAGHVPDAAILEWSNSLTTDGTFKTAAELRKLFGRAGVTPDKEVAWQDWIGHMPQMKTR